MNKLSIKKSLEIQEYHVKLCEKINHYNHDYYNLDSPQVSDYIYDKEYKTLLQLEKKYKDILDTSLSPTKRVGSIPVEKSDLISHKTPMLSLSNGLSDRDITTFYNRLIDLTHAKNEIDFECEPKLDGLAISIYYKFGILNYAATRGDGIRGENVTANVKTISNVPLKFKGNNFPEDIEIRGEIIIDKKDFLYMNQEAKLHNKKTFSTPRNAAAGSIRQLNSQVAAARKLKMYVYGIGIYNGFNLPATQYELMQQLKVWGFQLVMDIEVVKGKKGLLDYYRRLSNKRMNLPYDIDGLVYKVNRLDLHQKIGYISKAPRWALAHKFPSEEVKSQILSVDFQIGRTGAVTPVARLKPVEVSGVVISNATLHNIDEIRRKDIQINDYVIVRRAGDVIPEIARSLSQYRHHNTSIAIHMPDKCPICHSKIRHFDNQSIAYCMGGWKCLAQCKERIKHFSSRKAIGINGMGEKIIDQLVEKKIVKTPDELYLLTLSILAEVDGLGKRSSLKLLRSIEQSKRVSLDKFIYALGIKDVGEILSKKIAHHFNSLENFRIASASLRILQSISDIGAKTASNIYQFWKDPFNLSLVDRLLKVGIVIDAFSIKNEINSLKTKIFIGKIIVFSGTFTKYTRLQIKQLLGSLGAIFAETVSKKIDYLILGKDPGVKYEKAKLLGIQILSEEKLFKIIEK